MEKDAINKSVLTKFVSNQESLKYLYENEPIVAKEFIKRILKLPPDISRDAIQMIDFLPA